MDTARDKISLEHIDAEELWHIRPVDQDGFICIGCRLKSTPCSHNRTKNKRRPYFRFDNPDNHADDCFYEQDKALANLAKKKKISTPDGFPLSHPSTLILDDVKIIDGKNNIENRQRNGNGSYDRNGSPSVTKRKHNYSVKTISSIAKHYLKFPYDRKFMELNIAGIEGCNYSEVIKQLPDEIVIFQELKMRVGRLNNYKAIEITDSEITIPTLNGSWLNKKPDKLYGIVINIESWSDSKKEYIINSVKTSQDEHKENNKNKTYVFFIGEQSKTDYREFFVEDYRLFSCFSYR